MPETAFTRDEVVKISAGEVMLEGALTIPGGSRGIVVFAHGSGSSRHSPRNKRVAQTLQEGGLATLLMDLLTKGEEEIDARTGQLRFDIGLLAGRVGFGVRWVGQNPRTQDLAVGLFGASTGSAGALIAAAEAPSLVRAIVSRGGRPDLAEAFLPRVSAPTLLIVGGADLPVLEWNRKAADKIQAETKLAVVPGAGHLFEEPGALDEVSRLALGWFKKFLAPE